MAQEQTELNPQNTSKPFEELLTEVRSLESKIGGLETQASIIEKEIGALYSGAEISEENRELFEQKRQLLRDIQQNIRSAKSEYDLAISAHNDMLTRELRQKMNDLISRRDKIRNIVIPDAEKEIEKLHEEIRLLDRQIVDLANQLSKLSK